jgi:signal transduction histidine kinase
MEKSPVIVTRIRSSALRKNMSQALAKVGACVREAQVDSPLSEQFGSAEVALIILEPDSEKRDLDQWRRLKNESMGRAENSVTALIAVSLAGPAEDQAQEWLDAGVDLLLPDPFQEPAFLSAINCLLRLSAAGNNPGESQRAAMLQQEVKLARQEFHQFSVRASHDFQECFRAITTFAQFLEMDHSQDLTEKEKNYLGYLQAGNARFAALLRYIQIYSSLFAEDRPSRAVLALKTVISAALKALQKEIAESGAKIEIAEGLPVVIGNATQLPQVIQSLVGNAIKYRGVANPVAIQITATRDSGDWVISVHDNGMGIPVEYQESIFQPFKRLHGKDIPGTGMGLALCRRIVESHGGRIWVESSGESGATFLFTLPAREVPQ